MAIVELKDWLGVSEFAKKHTDLTRVRIYQLISGYYAPAGRGKKRKKTFIPPKMKENVHFLKVGKTFYVHKTVRIVDGEVTGGADE